MNIEKIFKKVVLADFLIILMMFLLVFFYDSSSSTLDEEPLNFADIFSLILLVVYIVNLYFLYKLKPIGKTLYIPLFIIGVVLIFAYPDSYLSYSNIFVYALETIGSMVSGLIIAMLYWTDIKKKFES